MNDLTKKQEETLVFIKKYMVYSVYQNKRGKNYDKQSNKGCL